MPLPQFWRYRFVTWRRVSGLVKTIRMVFWTSWLVHSEARYIFRVRDFTTDSYLQGVAVAFRSLCIVVSTLGANFWAQVVFGLFPWFLILVRERLINTVTSTTLFRRQWRFISSSDSTNRFNLYAQWRTFPFMNLVFSHTMHFSYQKWCGAGCVVSELVVFKSNKTIKVRDFSWKRRRNMLKSTTSRE